MGIQSQTKPWWFVERYKARLVAKGYSQSYGIDYDETYAPVAKMDSIIILLSIAVAEDYEMLQFDIKTAFLYGTLEEDIYMGAQPQGFEIPRGLECISRKDYMAWNKPVAVGTRSSTNFSPGMT